MTHPNYLFTLALLVTVTACQSKPPCPSATELGEQRRHCESLQQQIRELPADRLQSRGILQDQYDAECVNMLYYRENHASDEACSAAQQP